MAKVNRGKQFEDEVRKGFERVANTSVTRLLDPMGGYVGVGNICDFIVYHNPTIFFIECKCHYGNTLSIHSNGDKRHYGDISDTQWNGLLEQSKIDGVVAGVMAWFIDHDKTVFIPIQTLVQMHNDGCKSVNIKDILDHKYYFVHIDETKKRVLMEYDFESFLK